MIDGIKILNLSVKTSDLLQNERLIFPLPVDEKTGQIIQKKRTAIYNSLYFTIKDNNTRLNGSLHKYYNNGVHNYNDYYYTDLVNTINDLETKFNIDCNKSILNNVEFGVNIHTTQDPNHIFRSIINYKGIPFQNFNIKGAKGIECITNNFYIKIYNKSLQYKLNHYTLRYEIKINKMYFFKDRSIKIDSLLSLLNLVEYSKLKGVLLDVWDNILFTDLSINEKELTPTERLILSNGNNPRYWENLKPNSKNFELKNRDSEYKRQRKKYYRELSKFKDINNKYGKHNLKKELFSLIDKKCNELNDLKKVTKNCEKGQIDILDIVSSCPPPININQRKCLSCGKDISNKKRTAKFCSKKCKNNYTNPLLNPKNNLLSKINRIRSENTLFDTMDYIFLTESQRQLLNTPNSIKQTG